MQAHHPIPLASGLKAAYTTPPVALCEDCHQEEHLPAR